MNYDCLKVIKIVEIDDKYIYFRILPDKKNIRYYLPKENIECRIKYPVVGRRFLMDFNMSSINNSTHRVLNLERFELFVMGDIHGYMKYLKRFVREKRESISTNIPIIILQCGDFGVWYNIKIPTFENTYIYFTPGNHEHWDKLDKYEKKGEFELVENCFYMPRGSTLTLNDHVFMFMGGAQSIDRMWRTPGRDWFPQEQISQRDIYNLPDVKVDTVISHDCPEYFVTKRWLDPLKDQPNQTRMALNEVYKKYKPKRWFFGHYHRFVFGKWQDCYWKTLNMAGGNTSDGPWNMRIDLDVKSYYLP